MNLNRKPIFLLLFIATIFLTWRNTNANNIDKLLREIESKDRQTRLLAIEGLGRIQNQELKEVLLKLVFNKSED